MNEYIIVSGAPAAAGPYSHAVRAGDTFYVSGQIGADPATGDLAEGVEAQARLAIANMRTVLVGTGLDLSDVVKTTVFLQNMGDFATINAIYAEIFGNTKPARSCVQVAALPRGALFEIECVARKG